VDLPERDVRLCLQRAHVLRLLTEQLTVADILDAA